jgi:hypothetical protein
LGGELSHRRHVTFSRRRIVPVATDHLKVCSRFTLKNRWHCLDELPYAFVFAHCSDEHQPVRNLSHARLWRKTTSVNRVWQNFDDSMTEIEEVGCDPCYVLTHSAQIVGFSERSPLQPASHRLSLLANLVAKEMVAPMHANYFRLEEPPREERQGQLGTF